MSPDAGSMAESVRLTVNGAAVTVSAPPMTRLSTVLRDHLGMTGTKVGCDAGDCGACTVLLDGQQVCACLVPLTQAQGRDVATVEGLAAEGKLSALQHAFHLHGAAQCGICTPGMLMAAADLLSRIERPTEAEVMDGLGGVLCRCTGYRKIVEAVLAVPALDKGAALPEPPGAGVAVGASMPRADGLPKITGEDRFAADAAPSDALWLRVVRSPYPAARFALGDMEPLLRAYPGLKRVIQARDIPGENGFGIYPHLKDQPVLAEGMVRYRGEAVLALVGARETVEAIRDEELPIEWEVSQPLHGVAAALAPDADRLHDHAEENVLIEGYVESGDTRAAFAEAAVVAEGDWETAYVEHAYIEPEAGYAERIGDRVEVTACTQAPYMDRDEVARVIGLPPESVRILPSACGGGFGGKLDVSLQPILGVAAWLLKQPVRCVYSRVESMASSTKRHPAQMSAAAAADGGGKLTALRFSGDFDTGAYASWGPTVAGRVPVHATGPYRIPNVTASARAVHTNGPPSGAFRGFGVPQAAIAHEALMDDLAEKSRIDPLEFRHRNALRAGDVTATGQRLEHSVGLAACLEALRPAWQDLRGAAESFNAGSARLRKGVGVGCMWYGIGNTSMSNPSTLRLKLGRNGHLTLFNGAVDIGQGSTSVILQIAADALGLPVSAFRLVLGDTDRTPDAGKTSASRQTFVSGRAAELAARDLRAKILRLANAGPDAALELAQDRLLIQDGEGTYAISLGTLADALIGEGRFDPPTEPLDAKGQGIPYATYGFAAQVAALTVDRELGTVQLERIVAAHDVGRAINPMLVEGQIHGGIAQGIGLALMEEYLPGRTENLHDYLIPTFGDVPQIDIHLIEDREPLGPFGAKGIGEPALVPTAPAILGAIRQATGARITRLPALPHRVLAAIQAARHG